MMDSSRKGTTMAHLLLNRAAGPLPPLSTFSTRLVRLRPELITWPDILKNRVPVSENSWAGERRHPSWQNSETKQQPKKHTSKQRTCRCECARAWPNEAHCYKVMVAGCSRHRASSDRTEGRVCACWVGGCVREGCVQQVKARCGRRERKKEINTKCCVCGTASRWGEHPWWG
jgi:hypothetical protein